MTGTLQPLAINQRDQSLDVLRGFALAGVLFVFCVSDIGSVRSNFTTADQIIDWFKYLVIEGRMYGMLIVIFGIGFYVQLEKAKKQGVSLVPVFSRRLFGLLIIGFIHAILFSTRDILMFYAIAGILILAVRNLNNRQLLLIMLVSFFVVMPLIFAFVKIPFYAFSLVEPNELWAHIKFNWQFFTLYHQFYTIYIEMFINFMIGYWIGRTGLLQKLKADKKFRQRVLLVTAILASILGFLIYYVFESVIDFPIIIKAHPWLRWPIITTYRAIGESTQLVCAVLYATLLINLYVSSKGKKLLSPLAAFGQMALSNYLIQSLILVPYLLLFNKFENLPPFNGLILFLIVFALQLVFSNWWMSRYTQGPVEWLLRSLTYWKWQKIKRSTPIVKTLNPSFVIKNN